ncbi:MAG: DUF6514 family protein [Clostridia bacterium]|nr:DUF6514 family protein [Clostridia bacterium]MDR3645012.1 DUF6514 family protein [Clostridia bacterium]
MHEVIIKSVLPCEGQGSNELLYSLLENTCMAEGLEGTPVFGIRAELVSGGSVIDSSEVRDITPSRNKATVLMDLLAKNTVTPCTLKDVIEDYIAVEGGDEIQTVCACS